MNKRKIGSRYEEAAAAFLQKQGFRILGKNFRCRQGEIERLLDCKVNLKLWVKVQKNWRDSDYMMKNFGYREDEM